MSWVWLLKTVVRALHAEQLSEHGGGSGIRDEGLLDSALSRPQNKAEYEDPDVFVLAAAYAFGIAKNHPFIDGNKRTAFVVAAVFLELNGHLLTAPEAETVLQTLALASGAMGEDDFAAWLRENARKI